MFLIDDPFVSDFLIQTIKANDYKIVATPTARRLIDDKAMHWITEADAIAALKQAPDQPLYSNSENALDWITRHGNGSELAHQINQLKDKFQFRQLLEKLFPDFYYRKVTLDEINRRSFTDFSFPFVIKPSVGFFSIGVHVVNNEEDWRIVQKALQPEHLKSIFPESVLNTSNFIIEELITGEEYAIDYYHDKNGKVVLLNVLHHVFSSGTDTKDRVYSTSKNILIQHKSKIEDLLATIGNQLDLRNFPAHAEVRIDKNGNIVPIEINPLRFGGWCTSGDLLGVALGFNSYEAFFKDIKPDWDQIFRGKETQKFSIIVLDNSTGVEASDILQFNYSGLANDLEHALLIREFDIHHYPIFGFVFTETSPGNEGELYEMLTSDLKKYITIDA
jgi:hypothetical protein